MIRMENSTVEFQAKFSSRQEAVVSAFSSLGYRVFFTPKPYPHINRKTKEIFMPVIADENVEKVIKTIRGWVDHEMAHELFNSDTVLLEGACKVSKGFETAFRLIEDGRVERKLAEMLVGCKQNLSNSFNDIVSNEKFHKSLSISLYLLAKEKMEGVKKYGFDDFITPFDSKTIDAVENCDTCQDAYDAAKLVVKDIKEMQKKKAKEEMTKEKKEQKAKEKADKVEKEKKEKDEKSKKDKQEKGCESDEEAESDNGENKEAGESGESSEDGEGVLGDDGEMAGGKESEKTEKTDNGRDLDKDLLDESEERDESGKREGERGGDNDRVLDGGGNDDVSDSSSEKVEGEVDSEKGGEGLSEEEQREIDKAAEEIAKVETDEKLEGDDISKIVSDMMQEKIEKNADTKNRYVPYTKYDKVIDLTKEDYYGRKINYDLRSAERDVSVLSQRLRLEIMATKMMRQRYKDSGFLDCNRLHLLGMNTGHESVFYNRQKKEGLNTAVSLLIDSSGSMNSKRDTAVKVAYLLSLTMETLNVPNEVLSFTQEHDFEFSGAGEHEIAYEYSRYMPLKHYVHKSFDKMVKHCIGAIKSYGSFTCENTDGESVLWAASRLYARPEQRKILFVISDGIPQNAETDNRTLCNHLKEVVKMISKKRIECVGIGIQTDAVEKFYPNYLVLNSNHDIVGKIYGKMVETLRGAHRVVA